MGSNVFKYGQILHFWILSLNICLFFQATIGNGERSSTARAFLKPKAEWENLQIITKALVHKILTKKNNTGATATGVFFERLGKVKSNNNYYSV